MKMGEFHCESSLSRFGVDDLYVLRVFQDADIGRLTTDGHILQIYAGNPVLSGISAASACRRWNPSLQGTTPSMM